MSRENVGCYFQNNREAALFQSLTLAPTSSSRNLHRIIKLCLPIRFQFCFSNHHQRLLFHLMDACKTDMDVHAKVIPSIIKFIERADPNDPLWISCCESGFAFNLMKKTIMVAQAEDRDAIAGFLVFKMHEMSELLINGTNNQKESAMILIQEIFHTISASPGADWLFQQEKICLAVRNSLSACIPFNTPISACLAMKTLLCAREVARQLLTLKSRLSETLEEDDTDTMEEMLAQATITLESLYDSAEIVLHSEIEIDRNSLLKIAIQLQLNCCRQESVPMAFFEKTTQHVVAYLESHDSYSLHRAFMLEAQSLHVVDSSSSSLQNTSDVAGANLSIRRIHTTKRDISSLDEVYSITRAFLGTALSVRGDNSENVRQRNIYEVTVAVSKLISMALTSTSAFDSNYAGDAMPSSSSPYPLQNRQLSLQAVGMVRKCLRQIARLLQLTHVEAEDSSQSACMVLVNNCMALVESHVFEGNSQNLPSQNDSLSSSNTVSASEVSLIFLSMLCRAIRHVGIKECIYRFLFKISQKKLHGSMLLLVVSSLAQMMTTEGHVLRFSIHNNNYVNNHSMVTSSSGENNDSANSNGTVPPPSSPVDDLPHLISLLLKLEERVLHQCKTTMVTALEQQPSEHHSLSTVNRATFQDLRMKVRSVFQSITIVARSLLYEKQILELEKRFGVLVERFLAMMIEFFPIVSNNNSSSAGAGGTNVNSASITAVSEFITEIFVLNLDAIATMLDGINELTIATVASSDGIQLQEDTFGNLSKTIRLWVGITIAQCKIPSTMKSMFDSVVAKVARCTPPLVFGKFLGVSKSTDLADELIAGDPTLSEVISKCLSVPEKNTMQTHFGFPATGLTTASFFYLHAVQQLELFRVQFAVDVRPMVGYFSDLAQWTSAPKQKLLKKIAKQVEDRWMVAVNHTLLSFDAIHEETTHGNNNLQDNQQNNNVNSVLDGGNSTLYHIQLASNHTLASMGSQQYTLPQFNRLLLDQVLFFLERSTDDRDHVRFYCAKLIIRMISELPWMVSAFPASYLIMNGLEALAAIETALHTSSAYNPYTNSIRNGKGDSSASSGKSNHMAHYNSSATTDNVDGDMWETQSEEGGELFLMSLGNSEGNNGDSRFVSRHESLQQRTLQRHLSMKLLLPPLSFPIREDRFLAVSFDVMIIVYYWLSFSGLSLTLKESLLNNYTEKYCKTRSATSIATVIVQEMMSNTRPVYQHVKSGSSSGTAAANGSGSSSSNSGDSETASPFSKIRAQAVSQVQHLLDNRKKAQSITFSQALSSLSSDRLFDNGSSSNSISSSNAGKEGNTRKNNSDTISQSILSLLGNKDNSSNNSSSNNSSNASATAAVVVSDRVMQRRLVLSFRELVDHAIQKLTVIPNYSTSHTSQTMTALVLPVIQHLEDMLRLLKKEQRANARLWTTALVCGEMCSVIDLLMLLLSHFLTWTDICQRICEVLRKTLTLFPQYQGLLWTMYLSGINRAVTTSFQALQFSNTNSNTGNNSSSSINGGRGIYSACQYPLQLLSFALDARVSSIFQLARVSAQSLLYRIEQQMHHHNVHTTVSLEVTPRSGKTNVHTASHVDVVASQVLLLSSFKVLKMFHIMKGNVPVACNRILRESLYSVMLLLQPANAVTAHRKESIFVQSAEQSHRHSHTTTSSYNSSSNSVEEVIENTSANYSSDRTKEVLYYCHLFRDVLDDRVRWSIDYDRSAQQQQRWQQQQYAARTSTIATMSQEDTTNNNNNNNPIHQISNNNNNDPHQHSSKTLPPALYYGPEAAIDIVMHQTCRFQQALKRLPGFFPMLLLTADNAAFATTTTTTTIELTDAQLYRHRRFTLGITDSVPTQSGLQTTAKKLEVLLESSGLLTAWLFVLLRRIDVIAARYLSSYQQPATMLLDSPIQQQAMLAWKELQDLVDSKKLIRDIKLYKQVVKSCWSFAPAMVLYLQEEYEELSIEDGRRKGISHPHMFLFVHITHLQTHGLQRALQQDSAHMVGKVLEILLHPLAHANHQPSHETSSSPDNWTQMWYIFDRLPVAPIYLLLQHLARCQSLTPDNNPADDANNNNNNNGNNTDVLQKQCLSGWMRYVQRCLLLTPIHTILFYLPQLVQLLRQDLYYGILEACLRDIAAASPMLCHQLVWQLQTESTSTQEEMALTRLFNQQKRKKQLLSTAEQQTIVTKNAKYGFCQQLSGIDPLPAFARHLVEEITQALPDNQYNYLRNEIAFFNYLTNISHQLKQFHSSNKEDHPQIIRNLLLPLQQHIPEGVYMPTNPYHRVQAIDVHSAAPMQSAAKCPYLLTFVTTAWKGPDEYLNAITERHLIVRTPSKVFKPSSHSSSSGNKQHNSNMLLLLPPLPPPPSATPENTVIVVTETTTADDSSTTSTTAATNTPHAVPGGGSDTNNPEPAVVNLQHAEGAETVPQQQQQSSVVNPAAVATSADTNTSATNSDSSAGNSVVGVAADRSTSEKTQESGAETNTATATADAAKPAQHKPHKHHHHHKRKSSHVDHNQSLMNLLDENPAPSNNSTSTTMDNADATSNNNGSSNSTAKLVTIGRAISATQKIRITLAEDDLDSDSDSSSSNSDDDDGDNEKEEDALLKREREEDSNHKNGTNVRFAPTIVANNSNNNSSSSSSSSNNQQYSSPMKTRIHDNATTTTPGNNNHHNNNTPTTSTRFTSPARLKLKSSVSQQQQQQSAKNPTSSHHHVSSSSSSSSSSAASVYQEHIAMETQFNNEDSNNYPNNHHSSTSTSMDAIIFKVHDDCRQDVLVVQIIALLQQHFTQVHHLPIFLMPYKIVCNRTSNTTSSASPHVVHGTSSNTTTTTTIHSLNNSSSNIGGMLQVIPHVQSRDQLGKQYGAKSLLQYFIAHFGSVGSAAFHQAQLCFVRSLAPYAVLCYLLHIKDRHNGNILVDAQGHILHIDFGFILGISPGKNLGFEKAPFKITGEMVELMGGKDSDIFAQFTTLTIQCFLAAREAMPAILSLLVSFADAELPCFQYKKHVLYRCRQRFVPALSEEEAGVFMKTLIDQAVKDWTTSAYDGVQKLQNNIYSAEWK